MGLLRRLVTHCRIMPGFFDDLPVCDNWADLVVAYSSFGVDPEHGGRRGLREMDGAAHRYLQTLSTETGSGSLFEVRTA